MSGSDLDSELRRSAERTVKSILGAAREDAERLSSEADQRIADRRSSVMEHKATEHRAEARAAVASERHAAMRAVLLAQTRLVDRVLDRARALLPEVAQTEAYRSTLPEDLVEALQFVDAEGAAVRCSVDLANGVRDALRGRAEIAVEADDGVGTGFVVVGAKESVLVDGRLETRLDQLASALAIEIHARAQEL